MAVSLLTIAAALGTRAAFGVLLVPIADSQGWSRGTVAVAVSISYAMWALSAAASGALLDRYGPRRVFTAGAVLTAVGLALAAASREPWQLYLGAGVLAGIGVTPLVPNSQTVIIANWFTRQRGLAIGIASAGVGVGMLVLGPLTHQVVVHTGWQAAFLALAALFLLGIAPLNAVAQRQRPDGRGLQPDGAAAAPAGGVAAGPSLSVALHHTRFWLLAASCVPGCAAVQLLLVHGVARLSDVGVSPDLAATALGVSGAAAAVGMVVFGHLADRWGGEWAYTVGTAALIGGIGVLAVIGPDEPALLFLYAVLFALGFAVRMGALTTFMLAALARGPAFGTLAGILAMHMAVGSGIGPALGGWVFDHAGSYQPALALAAAWAALGIGLVWLAAPRRGVLGARPPTLALVPVPARAEQRR